MTYEGDADEMINITILRRENYMIKKKYHISFNLTEVASYIENSPIITVFFFKFKDIDATWKVRNIDGLSTRNYILGIQYFATSIINNGKQTRRKVFVQIQTCAEYCHLNTLRRHSIVRKSYTCRIIKTYLKIHLYLLCVFLRHSRLK